MRILVTGATGFVGFSIVNHLSSTETYTAVAAVRNKIGGFPNDIERFIVGDLTPLFDWLEVLDGIDAVIHTAAHVHVMHDKADDPLSVLRPVNVDSTLNLARQAAMAGVKRFVFISTIKVNGEETIKGQPFTAESTPNPVGPYAITKYEAELGLKQIAMDTGLEVVIIRPVLVYGPRVKGNFLNMMKWLYRGIPLPFGAINNKRSLVALDNLIDLIITCISHPAAVNQTFLVSDGEDLSTTELLKRMSIALNKPARLISIPTYLLDEGTKIFGKYEVIRRLLGSLQVDITQTRSNLGWSPPICVDSGLEQTADWYIQNQDK